MDRRSEYLPAIEHKDSLVGHFLLTGYLANARRCTFKHEFQTFLGIQFA